MTDINITKQNHRQNQIAIEIEHSTTSMNDSLDDGIMECFGTDCESGDRLINPFYTSVDYCSPLLWNDEFKEWYKNYTRILVLCVKNKSIDKIPSTLLCYKLKKSEYLEAANYYTLMQCSLKLLKNKRHEKNVLIIEQKYLKPFNHKEIALERNELVLFMPRVQNCDMQKYEYLYDNKITFQSIIKTKLLYNYFNGDIYRYPLIQSLCKSLISCKESEYWTSKYNCQINLTSGFIKRTFKYLIDASNVKDEEARAIIKQTINSSKGDYLQLIGGSNTYIDASVAIQKENSQVYRMDKVDTTMLTTDYINYINEIFDELMSKSEQMHSNKKNKQNEDKEVFYLFCTLLISKKLCHLVVNNKYLLQKLRPMITSYGYLFRYLFGYAWVCFYTEECIKKSRTLPEDRYVFDIDTAHELPFFPFCSEDLHLNPYITLFVNSKTLNSINNCHGQPMIKNYKNYGIDNLEGFKRKFNIFASGHSTVNIFDGLETEKGSNKWKSFAITGSLIPSCCVIQNPLMDIVATGYESFEEKWNRFFQEYHTKPDSKSDIDIMCNKVSVKAFIDETYKLLQVVEKNLRQLHNNDNIKIDVVTTKTLKVWVHSKYIADVLKPKYGFDKEYVIKNINSDQIREIFYLQYIQNKITHNIGNNRTLINPLYKEYYKIVSPENVQILVMSKDIPKCNMQKNAENENEILIFKGNYLTLRIAESLKFKLKSPFLEHPIEVFKITYPDYWSCVSRFHLPCVRGYFNGESVYLLPSCISALMTYVNIDYKYFAGMKDEIDIINKYRTRGFGIMLNKKEKSNVIKYNSKISKWKSMFSINQRDPKLFFGPKTLNSDIYKPGVFFNGMPKDIYKVVDREYIITTNDLIHYYQTKYPLLKNYGIDFLKFKTISESGDVNPIQKWLIDAAWSIKN